MLALQQVCLTRSGRTILDHIDFTPQCGQLTASLGANGAGKSTLLNLLAGEIHPDRGQVVLDGQPLTALKTSELAQRRAVLPQQPGLRFNLAVREVIAMGAYPFAQLAPALVDSLLNQAVAKADVAHLLQRPYPALSGGEQQRVQFARVLLQLFAACQAPGPHYLLLDEPTASLDPLHQHSLLAAVAEIACKQDVAVVVILHDVNLAARWCQQLVLLANGKLVAQGAPAHVLTEQNLLQTYALAATVLPHPLQPERLMVLFA